MSKKLVVKSGSETEVNGSYFACRLIRSGIPKGSALEPVLFNIFVNNLDTVTLIEFSGHMKLKGSVDNHNGWQDCHPERPGQMERIDRWTPWSGLIVDLL